jgi:sec-independent protein translocase protein TatA
MPNIGPMEIVLLLVLALLLFGAKRLPEIGRGRAGRPARGAVAGRTRGATMNHRNARGLEPAR